MSESEIRSYHGRPVIKEPVWTWEIPTYFFTGGIAGADSELSRVRGVQPQCICVRDLVQPLRVRAAGVNLNWETKC